MTYTVTTGKNASVFHDQNTGITVASNQEVTLTPAQYRTAKIQQALAGGHLVLVPEKAGLDKFTQEDLDKLKKKIEKQLDKGLTMEKIASSLNIDQVKALAVANDIEIEDSDTIEDLLKALFDEEEGS